VAEGTDFLAPGAVEGNEIQTSRKCDVSSFLRLVIPRKKHSFWDPLTLKTKEKMLFVETSGCDFLETKRSKSEE